MSVEPNNQGFGTKKKYKLIKKHIPRYQEETATQNYGRCLKCSEASGKTFACLNGLWFRLYDTFTQCWLALGMANLRLKGEPL